MSKKKALAKRLILRKKQRTQLLRLSDVGSLGASTLDDMVSMFYAIREAADEHSPAYNLAGIGTFLGAEYSEMVGAAGIAAVAEMEQLLKEASS